jgi:hypothetical protein
MGLLAISNEILEVLTTRHMLALIACKCSGINAEKGQPGKCLRQTWWWLIELAE